MDRDDALFDTSDPAVQAEADARAEQPCTADGGSVTMQ
jgi:hypothetical protein